MPPFVTEPVMREVVDPRLRQSLELITDVSAATSAQIERWWSEAQLPSQMGGVDVGGCEMRCKPAYCATLLSCLPRLLAGSSALAGHDVSTSDLPMLAALRDSYDSLASTRSAVASTYETEFDGHVYITLRNDKYADFY